MRARRRTAVSCETRAGPHAHISDAVPLPPRPSLDDYRNLARDLQRACEAHADDAVRAWAVRSIENLARLNAGVAPGAIDGCLANGQGDAARFFASLGAHVGFLAAAGVRRLDVVKKGFPASSQAQRELAWLYACGHGCPEVAEYLLAQGISAGTARSSGETGLHWAMYAPHLEIVRMLIRRGAPIDARDAKALPRSTGRDRGLPVDRNATRHLNA